MCKFLFTASRCVTARITGFSLEITICPEQISRASLNYFSGYLVYKNDLMFGSLEKDHGSVYKYSDYYAHWEQFCLLKTEFVNFNTSHLMLKIKNITARDSGNYSVYFEENGESLFEVIEGK